jgi:hypothetical protein
MSAIFETVVIPERIGRKIHCKRCGNVWVSVTNRPFRRYAICSKCHTSITLEPLLKPRNKSVQPDLVGRLQADGRASTQTPMESMIDHE